MSKPENRLHQPWLKSAISDSLFILFPPFLSLFIVILFPNQFKTNAVMPVEYWLILVVFVDVAHVYSTLYRTYFKPVKGEVLSGLLITIPLCSYFVGVVLYHVDGLLFWRILAYLAVYHFIRQQYGFMRLYSREEKSQKVFGWIDQVMIYAATIYPILFWHFDGNRNFSWFINGDFLSYPSLLLNIVSGWLYFSILIIYMIKECLLVYKTKYFNIPRNLLIVGTCLSWYFGIVYFNGDMAFTTLNVISHGIPYMALIWFFEKNQYEKEVNKNSVQMGSPDINYNASYLDGKKEPGSHLLRLTFSRYGVFVFIIVIVFLAYIEEGLWDGLVWKEHAHVFKTFSFLPHIKETDVLTLVVPLLAMPQATHYILDGYIWRKSRKKI